MTDRFGRTINYMRVSITGRCNLRCKYCMPDDLQPAEDSGILSYEEILRLCRIAVTMGIVNFKITGGEPLLRKDCPLFISRLKSLPGVEQVTLTTNGLLLAGHLDALCAAGIDSITISLDTLNDREYCELTGFYGGAVQAIMRTLKQCVDRGVRIKINTILLVQTFDGIEKIAILAQDMPVDVRFIEVMPIGGRTVTQGVSMTAALERLKESWPDLRLINGKRGNGPAQYYAARGLQGHIGFIGAMSQQFCSACNRIRLTSTGTLKPCLFSGEDEDIKLLLQNDCTDEELHRIILSCIDKKPASYASSNRINMSEHIDMCRIGG